MREELAPAAVIENVAPRVDGGRFAAKRVVGEEVEVTADGFAHGHEKVACALRYRGPSDNGWSEVEMEFLGNDRWRGTFAVDRIGPWQYAVSCWIDHLASWREGFLRRIDPVDVRLAARMGSERVAQSAARATGFERDDLARLASELSEGEDPAKLRKLASDETLFALARKHASRDGACETIAFPLTVERELARFSSWYELFPRSASDKPGVHGTFADVEERLDEIAAMGFNVVYLPPIHPVGREKRKGRNNVPLAEAGDVGSPWGIGAAEGGHTAVNPDLGTLADFKHLQRSARLRNMEIAMDIAFQVAPDHPWVKEHPQWFRRRPDGSIQYAENPPKKYEDIYPIDFDTTEWRALWQAMHDVVAFWAREGVEIFRVDNPHTKPFAFWEWLIAEIRREHPRAIFLSEAFTRPRVMHRLAKLGFSQSYTYFTWRTTKAELVEYFTELTQDESREYFRPSCWPNTPDILPYHLHNAGLAMFRLRLLLAATLAANYGIYGPAYELGENRPRDPGTSEEYLDSEKYEVKRWDRNRADSLTPFITRVNAIRNSHAALQSDWSLAFHPTDNDQILCYSKRAGADRILVATNLDTEKTQAGWVTLDLEALGLEEGAAFTVRDELNGESYPWRGARNFVMLDPARTPAHVFTIEAA
ncbi:MAG: alpha-1,4-glucan--maltose-1-phosphate maltosyltransferase [Burkholderiales bacterium]|nr:alpha-1,4-glucan--maltose-1-phosphate maltosyltransferase [Burkholderiales bacterium]